MRLLSLWADPLYRETFFLVMGFILFTGIPVFILRNKDTQTQAAWASLKSWLFAAPFLLALLGLRPPLPLVVLTVLGIFASKIFFQMMGMYHRSYFVWLTYVGLILLAYFIHTDQMAMYNLMPMMFLGTACMIPILRNSSKQMIQYIALTLMAFSFLGWSFMHLGWIWQLERGPYMVIYLIILTEVFDNLYLTLSRYVGTIKLFSRITPRRHLEAFAVAVGITFILAWGMRHLLPVRSEMFWMTAAVVACLGGSLGDLTLSVIRRDLGIKDVGAFIIGRGDLLTVIDRLIFVAPIYYYAMEFLLRRST